MKRIHKNIIGLAAGAIAIGAVSVGTAAASDYEYNARYDHNRDGIIDAQEHELMHYDADSDGRLDDREYRAMRADSDRHTPAYGPPERRHRADRSHKRRARVRATSWFRAYDRNRDAYLSWWELRRVRGAARDFRAIDLNGDRHVSRRELERYLARDARPVRYAQPYPGYRDDGVRYRGNARGQVRFRWRW